MSPKKDTQKSAKSTTATDKKSKGFTDEERAAMKERAQELKAEARREQEQGGRGKRRAREDRRDAGTGSRHGQAAPCDHQSQRASPLAENLVRDARVCQGRQGRLLLPKRAEVQGEVRDVRLQRRGEPRRRRHVADLLRAEGVDCRRRGKDRRAREESGELRTELAREVLPASMHQSETPTRELTLEEAISIAILLQKNEQLAEAEQLYRRIFEIAPDHPDALHYAGVLAHQQGRSDEAVALIERSLALVPDRADWYSNLASSSRRKASSTRRSPPTGARSRSIPDHANAHSNLGVLLRATGRPVEAEEAYRTAIRVEPDHIDAYTNLGILLTALKRTEEAVACFCKVITLRPKHREARRLLALAHCTIGEIDEAVKIFEEWLAEEPDDPIARHMLAACTGRDVPPRASDGFVAGIFDSFAASFESKLAKLSYRAPALVAAMLEESGFKPSKSLDVLDAGCGTGLCGPLVAPYARRLTGVDLSAGMLARAKEKNVYDELVQGELTEYLREQQGSVRPDRLGRHAGLFRRAGRRRRGRCGRAATGRLADLYSRARGTWRRALGYRLELHGRYSHCRGYVERLLTGAGLVAEIAQAELRMESGAPVAGLVIRAMKGNVWPTNLPCCLDVVLEIDPGIQ